MKNRTQIFLFFAMFLFSAAVFAQEKEVADKKPPLQTRFYIQGSYLTNPDNSGSGINDFRYLDPRSNFISPDLLEVCVSQQPLKNNMGFKVKVTGGEYASKIHARGLGTTDNYVDPTDFFVSYIIPVGNGIKLDAGKMYTHIGAEYLEALDNANYSNSFLFTYAEPTTHTGAHLTYEFSPKFSVMGHIYNGWDNFSDNNAAKTQGITFSFTPTGNLGLYFNVLNGPEKDENNTDNRFFFDWAGNLKISKNFALIASYDYGKEENYTPDGEAVMWNGYSIIGKYDFTDKVSFSVRYDKFDDRDGFRTGVSQILKEVTFTPSFKLGENVYIRPEYRFDWSTVNSFNNGNSNMQRTFGAGVMLNW